MQKCLLIIILLSCSAAWSSKQCEVLFKGQNDNEKQLFGLKPIDLHTHQYSQISLQQNLKALNELSANRPLDVNLHKELLKKDPFSDNLALGAARLAAIGLLNTKYIYKNLYKVNSPEALEQLIRQAYELRSQVFNDISSEEKQATAAHTNNVTQLVSKSTPTQDGTKHASPIKTNNVVMFGASFEQVLKAAITYELYNSAAIKVRLLQDLGGKLSPSNLSQIRALSSGQILVFQAAYKLNGSEVHSLKLAQKDNIDQASFVFLAQRALMQINNTEAFFSLFFKSAKIKDPNLAEIQMVSELIYNKELELADIIFWLSYTSKFTKIRLQPVLSLGDLAQSLRLTKLNQVPNDVLKEVLNPNLYFGPQKIKLKQLLLQPKSLNGFKVYDLRDDSLLFEKFYSLLTPELVLKLSLNPHLFNKFTQTFQLELKKLKPSKFTLLKKRYIQPSKDSRWEYKLYNSIVIEAFSRVEQSL